jgi:hypothetical protein
MGILDLYLIRKSYELKIIILIRTMRKGTYLKKRFSLDVGVQQYLLRSIVEFTDNNNVCFGSVTTN